MNRKARSRMGRALAGIVTGSILLKATGCPLAISRTFLFQERDTVIRDVVFFVLDTLLVEITR